MNAFNRLVVILLLAVILIVATVFFVVPKPTLTTIGAVSDNLYEQLDRVQNLFLLIIGVILAIITWIVCFVIFYLEIRRPRVRAIKAQTASGGAAEVAVASIAKRLTYHIDQLADVISVKPKISTRRAGGVDVDLEVEISPEIDIAMKDEEIRQVVTHVVGEQMGLKPGKIHLSFKDGPYPQLPG